MITHVRNPFLTLEFQDNIAIIWLDQEGSSVNKISPELVLSFARILDEIEHSPQIKGAILISRKKDFIAGADATRFLNMSHGEAAEASMIGQGILNRVAASRKNYIAAIHGACMGAGLEVALACHGRIASEGKNTVFALPEVTVGLMPGGGATQRLPRLIGIRPALEILLTGKNIYTPQAYELGLIDEVCAPDQLLERAKKMAAEPRIRRKGRLSFSQKLTEMLPATRSLIFQKAREKVLEKTHGNYPAPLHILECVETGYRRGVRRGSQMEIHFFDELVQNNASRQMIRVFLALSEMKKNPFQVSFNPLQKIGIIGADYTATGVALTSVIKGFEVRLKDISPELLDSVSDKLRFRLNHTLHQQAFTSTETQKIAENFHTGIHYPIFSGADIAIEMTPEDIYQKQRILAEAETLLPSHSVYAIGVSMFSISEIASYAQRPSQVVGVNYSYPIPDSRLLEIVATPKTSEETLARVYDMGIRQGKTCIVVKDSPGFYTHRILASMLNEAMLLLEEGGEINKTDKVMQKFGFPEGPFSLMDIIGLDFLQKTSVPLKTLFEARGGKCCETLENMVKNEYLGRKNNRGFYHYSTPESGKKIKGEVNPEAYQFFGGSRRHTFSSIRIQHRIALRMVNEAAYCLGEGIIRSPKEGDIGAILGLGFPAFLGGPFRFADSMGVPKILHMLRELEDDFGSRFKPAPIFSELAEQNLRFY
ncbi:MAG: enoyl-CoA hydratase-related protein [Bacteroidia bacterium]|nr:enoyl-CoA hydratase-related protein [Bacteroidia bacterium]